MAEDRFSSGKKEYGCKALEKRAERKVSALFIHNEISCALRAIARF